MLERNPLSPGRAVYAKHEVRSVDKQEAPHFRLHLLWGSLRGRGSVGQHGAWGGGAGSEGGTGVLFADRTPRWHCTGKRNAGCGQLCQAGSAPR